MNYIFNYNYIFDIFFGEIKGIILFIVFTVDKVPRKNRSSRQEVFFKKGVFRNFAKFTGKHLCQSLFFNKVAGLSLQLYLKKDTGTSVFL